MGREPLEFKHQARYIGSLKKDEQLCDFYELVIDGKVQYVYIPVGAEQEGSDQ
ncbi:MAG: hypothetical protein WBI99_09110 [Limnochordia bacterium]|jgi:hypothetical protein|nr:hypothetical protein [Limnochordia bacterium]MDI9464350.1 hypothetical protein [Bacillota bacterium]NLO94549.1 hypothetical protein [Bacillota bacterium]HOB39812.1 hypothetical protein [Limnochordia bacterium]HOK31263.1 hypothetical protein [Limnochordia bacterium]